VYERFTERAQQVVVHAHEEARALRHNYIGTEHMLLGLLRGEEGIAVHVLESLDITIEDVRALVAHFVGQGDEVANGQIPFTPRAKKVLELALREALSLDHNYVGTEHILLSLARVNDGLAGRILLEFDITAEQIRNEVVRLLSGPAIRPAPHRHRPKNPGRVMLAIGCPNCGVIIESVEHARPGLNVYDATLSGARSCPRCKTKWTIEARATWESSDETGTSSY